jgi:Ni/Fe-hydrogenase 1 B-type cytochrome subunit
MSEDYKSVYLWSGWFRASHWFIALSVVVLMTTGWLISNAPSLADTSADIHYYAASFLVLGIAIRVVLFFKGSAHERLTALFPDASDRRNMLKMMRFYLSFGKASLPAWYAHNPFWKPLYLFLYIALMIQITSGAMMHEIPLVWRFYLPSLHEKWSLVIFWVCIGHVAAIVLHDIKGRGNDMSAILHGYRIFVIKQGQNITEQKQAGNFISIGDIKLNDQTKNE